MAANTSPDAVLDAARAAEIPDPARALIYARSNGGPGAWRLFLQLLKLRLVRSPFSPLDWLDDGLWRPTLSRRDRNAYLPTRAIRPLNDSLRRAGFPAGDAIVNDKPATLALMAGRGLATVPVAALFRAGSDESGVLPDTSALAKALGDPALHPLFGKPVNASHSRGAVWVVAVDGTALVLADGNRVDCSALATLIASRYPEGYILQPHVALAPALAGHMGTATGSLRLVTLWGEDGPAPLYAVLKCTAVGALHDGPTRLPRAWALVDTTTGVVRRLRRDRDPAGGDLTHWQNRDEPLVGFELPGFAEAVRLACAGHLAFPGHGILGWDLFLTAKGPLISEVNANPDHKLWQQAAGRGFLTPEHRARLAPLGAADFFP